MYGAGGERCFSACTAFAVQSTLRARTRKHDEHGRAGGKTMAVNTENSGERRISRLRMAAWSAAALLLLLPLVAMQFTDEVNWTVADFVVAGALLFGVGVPFELAVRKTRDAAYRAAVGVALAAVF